MLFFWYRVRYVTSITMKHPFAALFTKALRKSTKEQNLVLVEAKRIKDKGYSVEELYGVLVSIQKGLIERADREILDEAVGAFEAYRR
jgi:hypothetical protein